MNPVQTETISGLRRVFFCKDDGGVKTPPYIRLEHIKM